MDYFSELFFYYIVNRMNSHIAIPNYQYHEEEITLDDFELIRCIGHGAYGQVIKWMDNKV